MNTKLALQLKAQHLAGFLSAPRNEKILGQNRHDVLEVTGLKVSILLEIKTLAEKLFKCTQQKVVFCVFQTEVELVHCYYKRKTMNINILDSFQ